mgnify:CR=1 FL=1
MQKKAARLFVLPILFLISCSGSSNDNPSSFADDPLNLSTGQCFNDFSSLDLEYGDDSVDAGSVEVVNCMSPHNGEVIAVYSSVPLSGRNSSDPASDLCTNEMFSFVKSFFSNLNDYEFNLIGESFDKKFQNIYYTYANEYGGTDINNTIVCTISSGYTLTKTYLRESLKELN